MCFKRFWKKNQKMVQKWHEQAGHSTSEVQQRRKRDHHKLFMRIFLMEN